MDIDGGEVLDGLVLGHLAPQHPQQLLEGLFPHLVDGLIPGDDEAGIDIHVVLHPLVGIGVAADLDNRHGGEALGGAPAGGEHHKLGAGGGHAG